MNNKIRIQITTAVVVIVFAVGIWLANGSLDSSWLRFYSAAVLIATIVLAGWEHFLWRVPVVQQRLPKVSPDLRGTWKGSLESFWKNPETGESPPVKIVYLVVHQSASSINVVLLTNESKSRSALAKVSNDGITSQLDYMYLNKPESRFEHRSRMHHGSSSFDIIGNPAKRIKGRYWTDRDSRGEMMFDYRNTKYADDYEDAKSLFGD